MSKRRKYRIVTNGEFFRVQKQRRFLGIKWWKYIGDSVPFINLSGAQQSMKNYENGDRCLEEIRLSQKEARKNARKKLRKNPWKPVKEEN